MIAITAPSRMTPARRRCGGDPNARRMPNSRMRALTEKAKTPATPTREINRATPAKIPNTTVLRRSGVSDLSTDVCESSCVLNRLVSGHAPDDVTDGFDERVRVYAGMRMNKRPAKGGLLKKEL